MPVLGENTTSKQVIHNRVSVDPDVMIPFNKSYASGIYAFVSCGIKPWKHKFLCSCGRKDRIKVVIEAYRYLISGQMGASLSHAIPHMNPIEIIVAYSEEGPLPFPVSPMYSDYISKTTGLMPSHAKFLYWSSVICPHLLEHYKYKV